MALWGGLGVMLAWIVWPFAIWIMGHVPRLRDLHPVEPSAWPRVSVIIPACNEADTIEPALASVLSQGYPNLEVVVIDDRSSDGTGAAISRAAKRDPRVRQVRVDTLPEGWLGKVHALHRGVAEASGEWLLFTDADVHFEPGALEKAVAFAVEDELQHLAILPDIDAETFFGRVAMQAFGASFFTGMWRALLQNAQGRNFIGVGAFNLVERRAFDETPGFEWLKMEVGDDVGLGVMMYRAGARSRFLSGSGQMHVLWYRSYRDMLAGMEKNAFPLFTRYSYGLLALTVLIQCIAATGPWIFALHPSIPGAWIGGLSVALLIAAYAARAHRMFGVPVLVVLAMPLGQLQLCQIVLRSAARCFRDGGITWRGTTYPIERLKAERRFVLTAFGPKLR